MSPSVAEVLLDHSLETPLEYSIPKEISSIHVGMRVEVPLRSKSAKGTILALKQTSSFSSLKPLCKILGEESWISPRLFQLALWMSKYYCAPLGKVLKIFLPPSVRTEKQMQKMQNFIRPVVSKNELRKACEDLQRSHPAQAKILEQILQSPQGLFLTQLLEKAKTSVSPIETLCKKKFLRREEIRIDRSPVFSHDFFPTKPKTLNEEQQKAFEKIKQTAQKFQPHLLFGITGSGKTEIYLQVIEHILSLGQGVIYLIPEIALTSQTIERFKGRFGNEQIAILHYRLSEGERFDAWDNIKTGKAKIVIGARSAIFSPVENLGLIIVDEEHESSFKQSEESPKYHARDVAVMRAKLFNCPVILGTATPSLESYFNALQGKYDLHLLENRADRAKLPDVKIVDMKREYEKVKGFTLFSEALFTKIKERFTRGEQTLLFLNRRGYHTSAQCNLCSYKEKCIHCEITLTYHRGENILSCHLCDFRKSPPKECPECHAEGPLKFKGVGTEMVEKTLLALIPQIRTLRLDGDTTRHKGSHERIFREFRSGKADVLIGTQMIAKGLHFPSVTLVGVIGLDGGLNIPDFRSSENVFQLLTQVAGRAGRGDFPGEVLIQTQLPNHNIILHAAKHNYTNFYAEEIQVRKMFGFPPFTHLIKFSFAGENLSQTQEQANNFRKLLIHKMPQEVEILPVVPCGYAKIKGKFRFQILLKTKKMQTVLPLLQQLRTEFKPKKTTRFTIDVDPQTTFF